MAECIFSHSVYETMPISLIYWRASPYLCSVYNLLGREWWSGVEWLKHSQPCLLSLHFLVLSCGEQNRSVLFCFSIKRVDWVLCFPTVNTNTRVQVMKSFSSNSYPVISLPNMKWWLLMSKIYYLTKAVSCFHYPLGGKAVVWNGLLWDFLGGYHRGRYARFHV